MPTCSIDDCDKRPIARGWCSKHYARWYKYGDPHELRSRVRGTCTVEGCDAPHDQHGLCHMHMERQRRTGSVADPEGPIDNLSRHTVDENGCWVWTGPIFQTNGYGQMSRNVHGTSLAHRAYWIEENGPIPQDAVLDHLCRNRLCVNPWHLDLVTNDENVRRGLSSFAIRDTCKNGLHDISRPQSWYSPPGDPNSRTCYACAKKKWHRADMKKRA